MNDKFDRVTCINLVNRKDKRQATQEKFDSLGIEVEWYDAVQYGFIPKLVKHINNVNVGMFNPAQPYEMGCALSHYTVIKKALEDGVEKLFVFEDDVCFHKDFNNRFERSYDALPDDWDMMMLYSFMYELLPENVRVNSRWIRSYNSWSMMAYGMNRAAMYEYVERQDRFFTISDAVTYAMQRDPSFKIYTSIPSLCVPNPTLPSNIRSQKNYEMTTTITNLGVDKKDYV